MLLVRKVERAGGIPGGSRIDWTWRSFRAPFAGDNLMSQEGLDEVGYWTEIKLQILEDYTKEYLRILRNQRIIQQVTYIDGFAGAGTHISKTSGEAIAGSPKRALEMQPGFDRYCFVDMNPARVERLRKMSPRPNVTVYEGDCNKVLLEEVFPKCRYEDYRRALCLLDPYDLNPSWEVVQTAGKMGSIEIFLNFMIMDANMNILKRNTDSVAPDQASRMTRFWGDDSWRTAAYRRVRELFGEIEEKVSNEAVVEAYRERLTKVAGFKYVPKPVPMRNTRGPIIYYLFFASPNATGAKIVEHIFSKYRNRSGPE
jgi:three-Cys-motif partner protein